MTWHIYSSLPEGYRWATAEECEVIDLGNLPRRFIQVRVGGTDESPWTDIAVWRG